jgi:ABC-2 type transport system ATP-binding protein
MAERTEPGLTSVRGRTADGSASTALDHRILITELTPIHASLEDACLALTHAEVEYSAATTQPRRAVA